MPRIMAPPPSGEFNVKLIKPFSGPATHTVEIIGEPNRVATVKLSNVSNSGNSLEKRGEMPADDVNELMRLVEQLKGFPSNEKDVYGFDLRLELQTFEIQWTNAEDDAAAEDVTVEQETKTTFKDVADSIDAAARTFAKQDAAI